MGANSDNKKKKGKDDNYRRRGQQDNNLLLGGDDDSENMSSMSEGSNSSRSRRSQNHRTSTSRLSAGNNNHRGSLTSKELGMQVPMPNSLAIQQLYGNTTTADRRHDEVDKNNSATTDMDRSISVSERKPRRRMSLTNSSIGVSDHHPRRRLSLTKTSTSTLTDDHQGMDRSNSTTGQRVVRRQSLTASTTRIVHTDSENHRSSVMDQSSGRGRRQRMQQAKSNSSRRRSSVKPPELRRAESQLSQGTAGTTGSEEEESDQHDDSNSTITMEDLEYGIEYGATKPTFTRGDIKSRLKRQHMRRGSASSLVPTTTTTPTMRMMRRGSASCVPTDPPAPLLIRSESLPSSHHALGSGTYGAEEDDEADIDPLHLGNESGRPSVVSRHGTSRLQKIRAYKSSRGSSRYDSSGSVHSDSQHSISSRHRDDDEESDFDSLLDPINIEDLEYGIYYNEENHTKNTKRSSNNHHHSKEEQHVEKEKSRKTGRRSSLSRKSGQERNHRSRSSKHSPVTVVDSY